MSGDIQEAAMIIITRDEVYEKLSMPRCISLMKEALSGLEDGTNSQNVRTIMDIPKGALAFMPCYLGARRSFGAKVISVYPGNSAEGYPSHQGYVILFDETRGEPAALADACAITEIRTAAASGAATDLLARQDSRHLAILGSGAQAVTHLEAMLSVRDIRSVTVWSYHRAHAERYADTMGQKYPALAISVCDTVAEAVREADIICTVCRSRDPFLFGDMVKPGTHINAVGTCSPTTREVSSDLTARSRLYVDQAAACKAESGEYLIPLKEGVIAGDHIVGSIGAVLLGAVPARQNDTEITLFDSLGLAVEDVICADDLYREHVGASPYSQVNMV